MSSNNQVYRELQKHIDKNMPVGFPETESGVEINLLKQLFTPEEAEIALEVSSAAESIERIHKRLKKTGISIEKLQDVLDNLVEKGAIAGPEYYSKMGMGKKYGKSPFIVGMYEFQAGRITKEFEKDARDYIEEKYRDAVLKRNTRQMRTIPISKSITAKNSVASYDNIRDIVQNTTRPIVVLPCVCREGADLLNEPCKISGIHDACLLLNENAEMYIEFGRGRSISKDEAFEIIDSSEEAGLVIEPANNQNPSHICFCCGCCCGVLANIKKLPNPAQYFHTNFFAEVDAELCKGCKKCVKKCQMEAITMEDKIAVIDLDRCIGCGVCVPACSDKAIEIKDLESKYVPPKNIFSMYQALLRERYGIYGMFKMMIQFFLGKKL